MEGRTIILGWSAVSVERQKQHLYQYSSNNANTSKVEQEHKTYHEMYIQAMMTQGKIAHVYQQVKLFLAAGLASKLLSHLLTIQYVEVTSS
jgi:hypothetical protein